MPAIVRFVFPIVSIVCTGSMLSVIGCGGGSGSMVTQVPITVSLAIARVVVSQNGTPVVVSINITSAAETAVVSVSGLPGGLRESYAASDTNPSGILTFAASASTPPGTYSPTVNVYSNGQFASTSFTLVVNAATNTGP
jgi:hypothetical protein